MTAREIPAPFVFSGADASRRQEYSTQPPPWSAASQKRLCSVSPSTLVFLVLCSTSDNVKPTNSGCVPCATHTASAARKAALIAAAAPTLGASLAFAVALLDARV